MKGGITQDTNRVPESGKESDINGDRGKKSTNKKEKRPEQQNVEESQGKERRILDIEGHGTKRETRKNTRIAQQHSEQPTWFKKEE